MNFAWEKEAGIDAVAASSALKDELLNSAREVEVPKEIPAEVEEVQEDEKGKGRKKTGRGGGRGGRGGGGVPRWLMLGKK